MWHQAHFLVMLRYNNDKKAVFCWGETKYGKLGVGNVAKFNEEMKKREQAKRMRGYDGGMIRV